MSDTIDYDYKWYKLNDNELKVIIMINYLSEDTCKYNGTLKKMREWQNIKSDNSKNIKDGLQGLKNKGYIDYIVKGRTYYITIIKKHTQHIVKLEKNWIDIAKNYVCEDKDKPAWITRIRVFAFIYYHKIFSFNRYEYLTYIYCKKRFDEGADKETITREIPRYEFIINQERIAPILSISSGTVGSALKHINLQYKDLNEITLNKERKCFPILFDKEGKAIDYRTIGTKIDFEISSY